MQSWLQELPHKGEVLETPEKETKITNRPITLLRVSIQIAKKCDMMLTE